MSDSTPERVSAARCAINAYRDLIRFEERRHRYHFLYPGGWRNLPSVTTVLKELSAPMLTRWLINQQRESDRFVAWDAFRKLDRSVPWDQATFNLAFEKLSEAATDGDKIREAAAQLGTAVHALIEAECKRRMGQDAADPELGPVEEEARWVYSGWEEWAKAVRFVPHVAEERVVFRGPSGADACGTLDSVGEIEGELGVIDWKTSKFRKPYAEMRLQSGAYRRGLEQMGGPALPGFVVRVPKEGNEPVTHHRIEEPLDDLAAHFGALVNIAAWRRIAEKN